MQHRPLGRTGLEVSSLGFGCGLVGGLMVGGSPAEQERAVARALDLGVRYFDTAPFYGGGVSEANLGRVLRSLRARPTVGTKVRIEPAARDDPALGKNLGPLVVASVEKSLGYLGVDCLDLVQLHNPLSEAQAGSGLAPAVVLGEVVPALQQLKAQGKLRCMGFSALGEVSGVLQLLSSGAFDTAQVAYSLLNPTAATPLPAGVAVENYGGLLGPVGAAGLGVVGIRLLAGGSLSGTVERHPTALPKLMPLGQGAGSGADYAGDVALARRFDWLVQEGLAESLVAAALRYGFSQAGLHTLAVGYSSLEHLEEAARAAEAGPFDAVTLARIAQTQADLGRDG